MTHPNTYLYSPPRGKKVQNPDEDFLRDLIFNKGGDYWSPDSTGDSAIIVRHDDRDLMLLFFYDEGYGFFLYYDLDVVPVAKGTVLKDDVVVKHVVGTEPMGVPSICYRSREEAWDIVQEFIGKHSKHEGFNWVPLSKIDYDREP